MQNQNSEIINSTPKTSKKPQVPVRMNTIKNKKKDSQLNLIEVRRLKRKWLIEILKRKD